MNKPKTLDKISIEEQVINAIKKSPRFKWFCKSLPDDINETEISFAIGYEKKPIPESWKEDKKLKGFTREIKSNNLTNPEMREKVKKDLKKKDLVKHQGELYVE